MRQTLRPSERVRRRPDFLQAYEHGRKQHGRYMTIFVRDTAGPVARVGVSATRKFGPAVVRNRAKRRARALFRFRKPSVAIDLVIIPRRAFDTVPFAQLVAEFEHLLGRLRVKLAAAGPTA